ncbi:MAG: ATP-binding protein [Spirochaetes bacterium]|nr:ATP-binding protein [Spirochaetota bacterium]
MKEKTILFICFLTIIFIFNCSFDSSLNESAGSGHSIGRLYANEITKNNDFKCILSNKEKKCFSPESIELVKVWETSNELLTSESVFYDRHRKMLYVSCINGTPNVKDGNGYIAKVSLDGTIINKEWIIGLNAPKGMGLYRNRLYVSDIDQIVEININSGIIINRYDVQGAVFLNDIAIDRKGTVYCSDSNATTIYYLSNGVSGAWLTGMENKPNGLLISHDYLYAGIKKNILKIGLADKVIYEKIPVASSAVDGLKKFKNDIFFISDWTGKTQAVNAEASKVLLDTTGTGINSADIEYIRDKKLLIIPTFSGNNITAYKVLY